MSNAKIQIPTLVSGEKIHKLYLPWKFLSAFLNVLLSLDTYLDSKETIRTFAWLKDERSEQPQLNTIFIPWSGLRITCRCPRLDQYGLWFEQDHSASKSRVQHHFSVVNQHLWQKYRQLLFVLPLWGQIIKICPVWCIQLDYN